MTLLGQDDPDPTEAVAVVQEAQDTEPTQTEPANQQWPDLFGVFVPKPPEPPEPEPEPQPPANTNYLLKGLFASAASSWAILADPSGEYLLRPGDELPGGAVVTDITEEGVWLETQGNKILISFEE